MFHFSLKMCQFGQKPEWPASLRYYPLIAQCLKGVHFTFQIVKYTTEYREVYFTSTLCSLLSREITLILSHSLRSYMGSLSQVYLHYQPYSLLKEVNIDRQCYCSFFCLCPKANMKFGNSVKDMVVNKQIRRVKSPPVKQTRKALYCWLIGPC